MSKYEQTKLTWRVVDDDRLLPLWCCTTAIEAPPGEVLLRLKGEQHLWDGNLVKGRIVERLSEETDVFHYVLHIGNQEAPREFCELRWQMLQNFECIIKLYLKFVNRIIFHLFCYVLLLTLVKEHKVYKP